MGIHVILTKATVCGDFENSFTMLFLFLNVSKFLPPSYTHTKCHVVPSSHTALPTKSPSVVYGFSLVLFLSSTKYSCRILWALPLLFPRLSERRVTGGEDMSIRVAATGAGSAGCWGFISGCILARKTSWFCRLVLFFAFDLCKTKSEEEKCKEANWDLENFEDGKQSFSLLFISMLTQIKVNRRTFAFLKGKKTNNKANLLICDSFTVAPCKFLVMHLSRNYSRLFLRVFLQPTVNYLDGRSSSSRMQFNLKLTFSCAQ